MDADVRESLLRAGRISREARERAVPLIKEGALLLDVAEEVADRMAKRLGWTSSRRDAEV